MPSNSRVRPRSPCDTPPEGTPKSNQKENGRRLWSLAPFKASSIEVRSTSIVVKAPLISNAESTF